MSDSEVRADHEDLNPAEALATAAAAREALVRRVAVPWTWHAFLALGMGVYLVILAEPHYWWAYVVLAPWPLALVFMKRLRARAVGVEAEGATSRTSDPLRWWLVGAALAVLFAGLVLETRWEHARLVSAVLATVLLFVGLQWLNHRLIARIRNAS
jgi:hypothetical protein